MNNDNYNKYLKRKWLHPRINRYLRKHLKNSAVPVDWETPAPCRNACNRICRASAAWCRCANALPPPAGPGRSPTPHHTSVGRTVTEAVEHSATSVPRWTWNWWARWRTHWCRRCCCGWTRWSDSPPLPADASGSTPLTISTTREGSQRSPAVSRHNQPRTFPACRPKRKRGSGMGERDD